MLSIPKGSEMAQTKKSASSSKQKKSTVTKIETNKNKTTKTRQTAKRDNSNAIRLTPYILSVIAILVSVCVVLGEGWFGESIKDVLSGLFAAASYLFPIFIFVRALLWKRDIEDGLATGRTICLAVVFLIITMLLHILGGGQETFEVAAHYAAGQEFVGGGVLGGLFGHLIFKCIGKTGSIIILFAAGIILALYVAGITPKGAFIYIAYKIKFANEERENRRLEKAEAQANTYSRSKQREQEYLEYLKQKKQKEQKEKPFNETSAYNRPHEPSPIPETAERFKIKKKDKQSKKDSDRIKDSLGVMTSEEFDNITTEEKQLTLNDQPAPVEIEKPLTQEELDEQKYNEVMQRTQERIANARKDDGATYSVSANDTLDAVGVAMLEMQVDNANSDSPSSSFTVETVPQVDDEVATITEEPADFDASGLFVNAEAASMIDRISEQANQKIETPANKKPEPVRVERKYVFPPVDLLTADPGIQDSGVKEELQENAKKLVDTLNSFKIKTKIENISRGPTITRYELLPEPGTRVRSIVNLIDDIALNLATSGVRIEAPIPGKAAVGIEVPNKTRATVHLRTLIEDKRFKEAKSNLTCCLGEDVGGDPVYLDIAKMPHLLIAGATGSGKSVCLNSIITSILYKANPEEVKMILIDPKKVELTIYNGDSHLLVPVVSDPKKAAGSLSWAVSEMERRYGLIEAVGVRDMAGYNNATKDDPDYEYMPAIVIVIDELADLMMTAPDDVENSICRIAQKARAAGMYLVIGTQRPSVDVITGLIKANIPSRIACRTSSQTDSRTIIDIGSAANLIGKGDMLYSPVGALKPIRVQGAYVDENDIEEVVSFIKEQNQNAEGYSDEIENLIEREAQRCGVKKGASVADTDSEGGDDDEDPMLKKAIELAVDSGKISTSLIQRRLSLGYGRAAKLIDRMEQLGYVSAPDGQKPREVLISKQDYMEMRLKEETPFD